MKHTFSISVEIPQDWIDYLTKRPDIFETYYAGYWLRGAERDAGGWLCWEDDDKHRIGEEPELKEAQAAFRAGLPLPSGWFYLNAEAAVRAWEEGVKKWGVDWYEETDSTREDIVMQMAMLGEVKYG